MFGIFNVTREDTACSSREKVKDKKNSDEPCYGGFSSRWSYEDCCKRHKLHSANPANAALCIIACVFFGLAGLMGGIIIYDYLQQNYLVDYTAPAPGGNAEIIVPSPATPDTCPDGTTGSSLTGFIGMNAGSGSVTFENVTDDLSKLYRIPRGVMIKKNGPPAETDIFKAGDIIVEVNDTEITDIDSLNAMGSVLSDSDSFTVTIFRKNKYIDLVIICQNSQENSQSA